MRKINKIKLLVQKLRVFFFFNSHHNVAKAKRGLRLDNYMCNGHTLEKGREKNKLKKWK
jgi:hypothetical protein